MISIPILLFIPACSGAGVDACDAGGGKSDDLRCLSLVALGELGRGRWVGTVREWRSERIKSLTPPYYHSVLLLFTGSSAMHPALLPVKRLFLKTTSRKFMSLVGT